MRIRIAAVFALLFLASCASAPTASPPAAATADAQDGGSIDRAVVIDTRNEEEGVGAEYAWIDKHYPGFSRDKQALLEQSGRMYDAIDITTAAGEKKTIYFDITGFFGKM